VRALLLLLTACWGTSQPAVTPTQPTPSPEPVASSSAFRARPVANACNRSVERIAERFRQDIATSGIPENTIDEMLDAAIESCKTTDWSADLLGCLDGVTDQTELTKCQPFLTTEQSEDLTRRMMEVVSRMNQVTPPPPPP
jgi:hypothetical protein